MAGMIDLVVMVTSLASAAASFICLRRIQSMVLVQAREPASPVQQPEPPESPEAPCVVPSASDEILAELEGLERTTRGASSSTVCSFWDEQDERDAIAEDEAILESRNIIRLRPARTH